MLLDHISNYENGNDVLQRVIRQDGREPLALKGRIKTAIELCNVHAPILLDALSERARNTVYELEKRGIHGLRVKIF